MNPLAAQIREAAVGYAQACVNGVREARGLGDVDIKFLCGSVFAHPGLADRYFDRIVVGASCPKLRLRGLLRLLKQGGRMAVLCDGQLLLLSQPADGGPVPEPTVLCAVPAVDTLVDTAGQARCPALVASPRQWSGRLRAHVQKQTPIHCLHCCRYHC